MKTPSDATELLRMADPVARSELAPGPMTASAQRLIDSIVAEPRSSSRPIRRRKPAVLAAAAMIIVGATAAWAYTRSGMLPEPAFQGQSWRLAVGEERNGADGSTYKVCHSFQRLEEPTDGNGLGIAGCGDWPSTKTGSVFIEVIPVLRDPDGSIVLFIDLTTQRVGRVSVRPDRGRRVDMKPFRMPASGKQYAVAVLDGAATRATVALFDASGELMEQRAVDGLAAVQQPVPAYGDR